METPLGNIMDAGMQAQPAAPDTTTIQREAPETSEARRALVSFWTERAQNARKFWSERAFKQMIADQRFCAGKQWASDDSAAADAFNEAPAERYIANITLRHVQQRTASIYGKNPTIIARRKPRLLASVWDGMSGSLQAAVQLLSAGVQDPQAMAVVQDAQQVLMETTRQKKIAESLQLLYEHELDEQPVPFKVSMKATVRRGLTTGVGWVKLGYERVMDLPPEVDTRIETLNRQLAAVERLSADQADGETDENAGDAEQLRLLIRELQNQEQTVVREGLRFTFPGSTCIIPDPECTQLRGFVGADWVAEEYFLSADKIKEIYKIDVKSAAGSHDHEASNARAYERQQRGTYKVMDDGSDNTNKPSYFCVWEIYNRADGMVYTICEGYPEFLLEPGAPDVYLERFYPWFPFIINEVYDEDAVFPPSDVFLIRDMQMELNRARQSLREHRIAGRPKTYAKKGALSEDDKSALENPRAHQVIELEGMDVNQDIKTVLQPFSGPPLDPRLYDPSPSFEDYFRVVGSHEANLGGTSGATATEASIAEGARATNASSTVDDLDEFLSEIARAAGQVLMIETPPEKVKQVVGPGAVWPQLSRDEIAREIYLDIEASSTGRPNKQSEIQNAQAVFPLLMQIPGITPEWMAGELIKRLDDRLDPKEAMAAAIPSVAMMNRASQVAPGANDPNAQGGEGGNNTPSTQPPQVNDAPRPADPASNPMTPM